MPPKNPDSDWPKVTFNAERGRYMVDARADGRGSRRFFAEKSDARLYAAQQRAERREGGTGAILDERTRRDAIEAKEILDGYGVTLAEVARLALPMLEKGAPQRTGFAEAIEAWKRSKLSAGISQKHANNVASILRRFGDAVGKPPCDVSTADIDGYLEALQTIPSRRNGKPRAASLTTKRGVVAAIKNGFEFWRSRGIVAHNPASKIEIRADIGEIGILRPAEAAKLLDAAEPELVPALAIAMFSGLRRSELAKLDWRDVRLSERLIEVRAKNAKTRQRRLVEIPPNLALWLAPYARDSGKVASGYDKRLQAARKRAKLKHWPQNALRHSAASYALALTGDENRTAANLGHAPAVLYQHYRSVATRAEAEKFFAIEPAGAANVIPIRRTG